MDSYPLSPEQVRVAETPSNIPQLVIAPPGTGKTHTVIGRIRFLVETEHLRPGELLVLCFTRAAVREINTRLSSLVADHKLHDDLRFVSVKTFDSFATDLLLRIDDERDLSTFGYDERIELAVESLNEGHGDASRLVKKYKHVIVDEIQDLTGPRARLVQCLLRDLAGHFTLLGDPAQAIYGFSLNGRPDDCTPDQLLAWVRKQSWSASLMEAGFSQDFRSEGGVSVKVSDLRSLIVAPGEANKEILELFQEFVRELDTAGSGNNPGTFIKQPKFERICILCRTNGEAMQLAALLNKQGIANTTKPRADDAAFPAWIARIFADFTTARISRKEFEDRWAKRVEDGELTNPLHAWNWIKRLEGTSNADIEMRILHRKLLHGHRLPDDEDAFLHRNDTRIAISTIHSVKGREFDQVLILEPETRASKNARDSDPLEEARVLYVAATRARKALAKLNRDGLPPMMYITECGNGRRRWKSATGDFKFIELGLHGDVNPESYTSKYLFDDHIYIDKIQEQLWQLRHSEFAVCAKKITRGKYEFLNLYIKGQEALGPIGQLSLNFIIDVRSEIKRDKNIKYAFLPERFDELPVAAVVTEVFKRNSSDLVQPYSQSGFCLGVRIHSMVFLHK